MNVYIKACTSFVLCIIVVTLWGCRELPELAPPTFDITVSVFDSNIRPLPGARVFLFDHVEQHIEHIEQNPNGLPNIREELVKIMGTTDSNGQVFFEKVILGTTAFNRQVYFPNELFIRSVLPVVAGEDSVYLTNDLDRYANGKTFGIQWDEVQGPGQHLEKTVELLIR